MTREENLTISAAGFAAFQRGDGETVLAMADPEIQVFASSGFANSGLFHGHEGYLRWVGEWLDAWDDFNIEVIANEPVGERHVVTSIRQTATGKGSGIPVEMGGAFLQEVKDGKLVALHLYVDVDAARAVAERREAGEADATGD